MDGTYNLNDISIMTGFTTRTLRNYMNQGLLKGEKVNGAWQFSTKDVECFFAEPYVKEGLRIKRSGIVFDFMADRNKKKGRICVILDLPAAMGEGRKLSDFFCRQMETVSDTSFTFDWDKGQSRVILTGDESQVSKIMREYYTAFKE